MFTFISGAMGSGKSAQLIDQYDMSKRSRKSLLLVPSLDTRNGIGKVTSRNGKSRDAIVFDESTNLFDIVKNEDPEVIFVDEVQFAPINIIKDLSVIADQTNIDIYCYGLLTDFKGQMFKPIEYLLRVVDHFVSISGECKLCGYPWAVFNMRTVNGKPVFRGPQIQIGGDESYTPVCRKCYREKGGKI